MAKMGRPPAEIDKRQFEQLCSFQCTRNEICDWFGITDKTLNAWCRRTYGQTFSVVFEEKRSKGKISLRRFQFQLAERNPTMAIFLGKQILNQQDRTRLENEERAARIELLKAEIEETKERTKRNAVAVKEKADPHDLITPALFEVYDDTEHEHQIITSGRAGAKSSFAGILGIDTICSDEPGAVVVIRKFHNKLRKTVYKEMLRAIKRMGMSKEDFEITVSPMQIRNRATGNTMYFSGSDNVDDTKGIIDEDVPIKLVIIDEATEFFDSGEGEDELSNIEATFVRGNDEDFRMLYLYNPPKNPNADINQWCKKMEQRPDAIHIHTDYREVPVEWIGRKLVESAETLKNIDLKAYRWLWLGEAIGIDELVYYMFTPDHVQRPEGKRYTLYIGGDYGQMNATTFQAFGLDISKRRFAGLDEYYHSGRESGTQKSPSKYADDFAEWAGELNENYGNGIIYLFLDPSAKGLAEEIKRKAPFVRIRDAENAVALGISRVQKLLSYNLLQISPTQQEAANEFNLYSYDKKSIEAGKETPVKINDHCMDSIRYAVMGAWSKLKYFLPEGERE